MKPRTIAIVLGIGAAAALAGRALVRPPAAPSSASTPATPPTRASISVYDDGKPLADHWVVFHDEAGGILASVRTGRDGRASGPIAPGGMITVAHGSSVKHLVTVTGVSPDDRIVVGEEEDEGGPGKTVCTALVSMRERHPRAARYTIALGVNRTDVVDPEKGQRASVLQRFLVGGRFRVLAEAWDERGEPIAYAHAWFSGCGDGGTVEAKLPAWSLDQRTFSVDVTGGGAEEGATIAGELALVPEGADAFVRNRREAPLGDRATLRFTAPRPLGASAKLSLTLSYPGAAGPAERAVLDEKRKDMPEAVAIDLRARMLPRVSDPVVDGAGTPRPAVRFRVRGDAAAAKADALVVRLAWPKTREHVWTIVAPPDAPPRIAVPALPDELASWRPGTDPIAAAAALVDASFLEGYADVKRKGLEALEDPEEDGDTVVRWSIAGPW